jgi:uncharacterized protein (TIGR03067 family)
MTPRAWYLSGVLALVVLNACDLGPLAGADAPKRSDPLAGTWVVVSTTNGGKDDSQLKGYTATFAGGKLLFKSADGKEHAAMYTLDASNKPATIDLVPADGPHQGKTLKGIYVVEQGELKLCLGKEGQDRPTAFSSKAGEQTVLLALRKSEAGNQGRACRRCRRPTTAGSPRADGRRALSCGRDDTVRYWQLPE